MLLKISHNLQESTCVGVSFLIKLQGSALTLFKLRPQHRCFPVNFANFLRTPFCRTPPGGCFVPTAMHVLVCWLLYFDIRLKSGSKLIRKNIWVTFLTCQKLLARSFDRCQAFACKSEQVLVNDLVPLSKFFALRINCRNLHYEWNFLYFQVIYIEKGNFIVSLKL